MNPAEEEALLDKSCAKALNRWATIIQENKRWSYLAAQQANSKLHEDLSNFRMPDYNDWYVPPSYIVRYQLRNIYMAKVALRHLDRFRERRQNTLRIIDFGSGASACRIAASLMVMDSYKRGKPLDAVEFVEIDSSVRMRLMGSIFWQEFLKIVVSDFADTYLEKAVEAISSQKLNKWRSDLKSNGYTWITAFHAIYPDSYDMGIEFEQICRDVDPTLGVFTCHRRNWECLAKASPFVHGRWWIDRSFPDFMARPKYNVECRTDFTAEQAKLLGFWEKPNLYPPYLNTPSCAVLWGSDDPSIEHTLPYITVP